MHITYPINLIAFNGTTTLLEDEATALTVNIGWRGINLVSHHNECFDCCSERYIGAENTHIARDDNGAVITIEDWPANRDHRSRYSQRYHAAVTRAMELGLPIPNTSCWKKGSHNNKKRHVGDNRNQEGHSQQMREACGNGHVRRARPKIDWDRNYRHRERNWKRQRKTQWK